MEEVFIFVPHAVTLADVARVLRRSWPLDEDLSIPYVQTGPNSTAYVAEPEITPTFMEELLLDDPDLPDRLRSYIGEYRLLSLRYRDPSLARAMVRAIATSELASKPMLIDADGTYRTPADFLVKLDGETPWKWSAYEELSPDG